MAVERAFGQLKGIWRILSRILWKPKKDRVGPMIYCCCILHNLLIDPGESIRPELLQGISAHPGEYSGVHVPRKEYMEGGQEVRDNLLNEVWVLDGQRGHRNM
jgi:DDE superfamily endonuclease